MLVDMRTLRCHCARASSPPCCSVCDGTSALRSGCSERPPNAPRVRAAMGKERGAVKGMGAGDGLASLHAVLNPGKLVYGAAGAAVGCTGVSMGVVG